MTTEFESDVLDLIKKRRSGRAYANQDIEPEKIKSLFEAARWAPSSANEQPWTYVYATRQQPELFSKIFDALNDGNKIWAKDAPMLLVSLARKNFTRNERPNGSAKYDMGAANAFLSLQATQLGLNVHQIGGFNEALLRENLKVPASHDLGVVMAIGYPGDPSRLPDVLQERERTPRVRWPQEQFVLNGAFE